LFREPLRILPLLTRLDGSKAEKEEQGEGGDKQSNQQPGITVQFQKKRRDSKRFGGLLTSIICRQIGRVLKDKGERIKDENAKPWSWVGEVP
jgi:hypothetical protein